MGSACTDQNFTSENATLDGVVYFFSFEFTKLLTLFKEHYYFFEVSMYHIQRIQFFSEGKRNRVIIN